MAKVKLLNSNPTQNETPKTLKLENKLTYGILNRLGDSSNHPKIQPLNKSENT